MRNRSENFDFFNTQKIYLVFTIFCLFYTIHGHFPIEEAGGANANRHNMPQCLSLAATVAHSFEIRIHTCTVTLIAQNLEIDISHQIAIFI